MTFTIISTLTRGEHIEAIRRIQRPKTIRIALLFLFMIGFVAIPLFKHPRYSGHNNDEIIWFVIIFLPAAFLVNIVNARRKWKRISALTTVRYVFSEAGIYAVGDGWTNTIAWKRFYKIDWTKKFVPLYYDSGTAIAIPLSLFTQEQKEFISHSFQAP